VAGGRRNGADSIHAPAYRARPGDGVPGRARARPGDGVPGRASGRPTVLRLRDRYRV